MGHKEGHRAPRKGATAAAFPAGKAWGPSAHPVHVSVLRELRGDVCTVVLITVMSSMQRLSSHLNTSDRGLEL